MRDEAELRGRAFDIGRNPAHDISVLVHIGLHAHGAELVAEHREQVQLLCRGRLAFGLLAGLRVHCDISEKSVKDLFHNYLSFFIDA